MFVAEFIPVLLQVMAVKQTLKLSQKSLNKNAIAVIKQLNRSGFNAYLVGGCVRDLILGKLPKDFDVATNAKPEQIRSLFKRSRIIGKRFRLVHILFGRRDYLEVSTFRSAQAPDYEKHHQLGEAIYGTIDQDAKRRDFSINALYYDINKQQVLDYVGGIEDIKQGKIRIIGNELLRYQQDPVRLLRAVRFSIACGFSLSEAQKKIISKQAKLLNDIPSSRLYEEAVKLFHHRNAKQIFSQLYELNLLAYICPYTKADAFVELSLENTASRINNEQKLSRAFFLAVFLWQQFLLQLQKQKQKPSPLLAVEVAKNVLLKQKRYTSFAKYIGYQIIDIWLLQSDLEQRKIFILKHKRFRAAYDFLLLRSKSINPELAETERFWYQAQSKTLPLRGSSE